MVDSHPPRGGLTSLRGRASECALLDGMIAALREGQSRTLVIRGEAGIGKTALLEYLVAAASDLMVVPGAGVESEMEVPFAGLHQLCRPLLNLLERLPAPQREALGVTFGLSRGPAPDRLLVALAVLSLLTEGAEEKPLLCVVDDAQWLDQASAQVLGFVARRLLAEPVGLVFAAREPGRALRGLPELEVVGLKNGDARALLNSVVRFVLDERTRDLIVAETQGNPLALLQLPRGLTATQLAGGFGLLGAERVSGRIEESFVRRVEMLPKDARRLLLVAAAEPVGDPLLLWRAAQRLGISVSETADVDADGLMVIGERVAFHHPLVRSAVYGSASSQERRAVHRALAQATDAAVDPDRRAWHLAAAVAGLDEEVAGELERSAGRAQARGGLAAAAAFLQRSVLLTQDPTRRTERALAAASASLQAGEFATSRGLLATAEAGRMDELQRARLELLRGQIAFASRAGSDAPPLLLNAAKRLANIDIGLSRETYLDAWGAAAFAGHLATGEPLLEISRAAQRAARPAGAPRPSDLLLDALATLITGGCTAATPMMRKASQVFAHGTYPAQESLRWGWLATVPSYMLWDEQSVQTINARELQAARDAGALARLPIDLSVLSLVAALCGDFETAAGAVTEADAILQATGTQVGQNGATLLAALRGREAPAVALIESAITEATAGGQGTGVQWGHWVTAILFNGLGQYDRALAAARRASEGMSVLVPTGWALAELIVAASRSGNTELGAAALDRLTELVSAPGTDWGLGLEARSRAVLSHGATAESFYREAIERLGRTGLKPDLARAHLHYGEWLRRERRRVDARAQLRIAYEMLAAIGMEAFAERARQELLATGEKLRKRTVDASVQLTAQERQIARLAVEGLSNPEIGARLFISRRTVEWHLRHAFAKLGIASRVQLHGALPPADPEGPHENRAKAPL